MVTRVLILFLTTLSSLATAQRYNFYDSSFFKPGVRGVELVNGSLTEISGMAASRINAGYLWVHNDGGNPSEIFLIDDSLRIKLTCKLPVMNRDWEDIAVGPGPDPTKNYIYLGDIGDNLKIFPYKIIYRFEEPKIPAASIKVMEIKKVDAIVFTLPGETKDSETLMLDPNTRNLYILTKWENPVQLYEISNPTSTRDTLEARKVLDIPLTLIAGGDISPDGKEILIKNYRRVFYWQNPNSLPLQEVMNAEPKIIPYEEEAQGEAIAWKKDGTGFYTVSEQSKKKKTFLWIYPKR